MARQISRIIDRAPTPASPQKIAVQMASRRYRKRGLKPPPASLFSSGSDPEKDLYVNMLLCDSKSNTTCCTCQSSGSP